MKNKLAFVIAIFGWIALILNVYLKIINSEESIFEATIRMFSYFTILTNFLATLYFTYHGLGRSGIKLFNNPGILTALAGLLCLVGLVFHLVLNPGFDGVLLIASGINHTVYPIITIIFWYFYEDKKNVELKSLTMWMLYPFIYTVFVILRGLNTGYFVYPFFDVGSLGLGRVMINATVLFLIELAFLLILRTIGRLKSLTPNNKH